MSNSPLDDEFDRQTFYRGADAEADAEEDYELLPPDEEVIAGEKLRADEAVKHASQAVDVDELYREETSVTASDIEAYLKDFRFQFGVKHLLMAMTALAVMFVVGKFVFRGFAPLLVVLTFSVLASIYGWFTWQEHLRREEWERKRDELYRRNQERHKTDDGPGGPDVSIGPNASAASQQDFSRIDSSFASLDFAVAQASSRLAFSLYDLFVLMTLACFGLFGTVVIGLPGTTLLFGLLLVAGLCGYTQVNDPPRMLGTGLVVLLALYVIMSVVSLLVG